MHRTSTDGVRLRRRKGLSAFLFLLSFLLFDCRPKEYERDFSLEDVSDFAYQLQNIDLVAIGATVFDLVIIDYSRDGGDERRFSHEEILALKSSSGGKKIVLAYMSIGEAEDYRWCWKGEWDENDDGVPDTSAPSWLGPENPDWPGNYKVKYWEQDWKSIIFGSPDSHLDKIIEIGFDGVYLDLIDAYEYRGPGGESGPKRTTAEREMVEFVKEIAHYARVVKGKTNFIVILRNGEGLSVHRDYVDIVDGIGKEDLWYYDDTSNPSNEVEKNIYHLDVFKRFGERVLMIDYVRRKDLIDYFYSKAGAKEYAPYATAKALNSLVINPGHEPD